MRFLYSLLAVAALACAVASFSGCVLDTSGLDATAGDAGTASETSSLVCTRVQPFTHLCTAWAPSLLPDRAAGAPTYCVAPIPVGGMRIYTGKSFTGYCMQLFSDNYLTLGDWDSDYPLLPSFHVASVIMGPNAYAEFFSEPNDVGYVTGFGPHQGFEDMTAWSISSISSFVGP